MPYVEQEHHNFQYREGNHSQWRRAYPHAPFIGSVCESEFKIIVFYVLKKCYHFAMNIGSEQIRNDVMSQALNTKRMNHDKFCNVNSTPLM